MGKKEKNMKKLKNTWKRFGAVACAFALTVTLAFPINSYAENETVETESVETMLTETEETAIPVEAQAEDGLKTSRMITIEAVGYYVDDSGNEKTASCNFPMQMEEEKTTYGEVRQQVVNTLNNWVQTEGSTVDCFGGMKIQNWNIKPYYQIGNPDFSDDTIIALWTLPDRIRVDAEASYDKWLLTYLMEVFNDEGKFYEEFYETVEKSEAGTAIRVTEKYADQMEYAGDKGWKDMKSGNIYQPGDTLAIQKNTGLKLSLEYEGTFNPIGRDETAPA